MTNTNPRYIYYRPENEDAAEQALLGAPALVIEKAGDQYPRSYREQAALVSVKVPGQARRETLIRVPVDYTGQHTAPADATRLNDIEGALVMTLLAMGGRSGKIVKGGFREGAALPDDYDPASAHHVAPRSDFQDVDADALLYRVPYTQLRKIRDVLEDPAAHKGDDVYNALLGADGATLPELVEMRNGAYLVYNATPDHVRLPIDDNADLGEYASARAFEENMQQMFGGERDDSVTKSVQVLKRASHAEFAWIAADAADIKAGTRVPEPPVELDELYCTNHFRAQGASYRALQEISQRQIARNEAEKALEVHLFGPPSVKQTFNVQGRTFATYDTKLHPVFDNAGHAVGIRCDWRPLHPNYTGMENVDPPEGWEELKSQPGVFAPNPVSNPEDVEKLKGLDWPDYRDYPEAFGGPEPVIRIEHPDKATYPRAYREYSHVHALQDENGPLYYIDAPTDYKDRAFHPVGAERVSEFEYSLLRSGMGDMYEPAFRVLPEGMPTPDDYVYDDPEKAEREVRYFTLAGRSKQIYRAFQQEREAVAEARRKFVESVGGSGSYSYQGAEIISVEFENDVPPSWVSEREYKGTDIDDDGNLVDVARYTCVPDTATQEGRELARRMKEDFTAEPDFRELQRRWTPNAPHMPHPQWKRDEDNPVFYYAVKDIKGGSLVPPPDAVELKPWLTQWLERDLIDRQSRIKPPPMPPAIKAEVDAFKAARPKNQEQKKQKGPAV